MVPLHSTRTIVRMKKSEHSCWYLTCILYTHTEERKTRIVIEPLALSLHPEFERKPKRRTASQWRDGRGDQGATASDLFKPRQVGIRS